MHGSPAKHPNNPEKDDPKGQHERTLRLFTQVKYARQPPSGHPYMYPFGMPRQEFIAVNKKKHSLKND